MCVTSTCVCVCVCVGVVPWVPCWHPSGALMYIYRLAAAASRVHDLADELALDEAGRAQLGAILEAVERSH